MIESQLRYLKETRIPGNYTLQTKNIVNTLNLGLKMNITKTKVMVVDNTPINVNNVLIENVPGYVYLGQHYSLKEKNQEKRHNEESWQAGRHTPNTGISSKATLPSA